MNLEIKDLNKSQKQIDIELTKEEFDSFIDKAYIKAGSNMEVKGFRKGKIPRKVIEEAIGKEGILVEAGDLAVQESYKKAVLDNKLEPVSPPEVKIKKIAVGEPMAFEAKVSVMPEVNLPDYRKIAEKIKRKEVKVEDKEVQTALDWVKRSRAKFSAKLGPAQKGDFVEIEYFSPDIEEINQQNVKKDAFVLGEGHFIPGFEDILIGSKAGEEKKNISLNIPLDHSFKRIAGRQVSFNIKVNSVQRVEFPELNDEFAKSIGKFESLDQLKDNIRQGIKQEKEMAEKQRMRNELLDKISSELKIEIPEVLIKRELQMMQESFKKDVPQRLNISYKDYLEKINKSPEEIEKMLYPQAEKKIKSFLVLREIGKRENIEVLKEEVEQEANKILNQYQNPKEVDLDPSQLKDYTREVLRTEKIFSLLESIIK